MLFHYNPRLWLQENFFHRESSTAHSENLKARSETLKFSVGEAKALPGDLWRQLNF
jgi:hypothetical protein